MKRILLFFALLLQAVVSHAQFKVSGLVTDSIGEPIGSAVVALMHPQNGMPLQQGITTTKGQYNLRAEGEVQLLVGCLGYRQYVSPPFIISSDTVLTTVKLAPEDFLLKDVVVIGEKQTPSVKIENGKMIFTPPQKQQYPGRKYGS